MAQQGALGKRLVLAAPQGAMGLQLGMEAQLHLKEIWLETLGELGVPLGALKLRLELKARLGVLGLGQPHRCEGLQDNLFQMQMRRP